GTLTRVWAKRGTRPRAPHDQRYDWAYLFGAACPQRRVTAGLVIPAANAEAMSLHLTAIGRKVAAGSHAALILDGAGYHLAAPPTIPKTSLWGACHPMLPNSTRSKTSGNISAATNSPSPSSTTTTTSLIKPATHGTSLNKIQCASPQSPPEHGRLSMIRAVGIRPPRSSRCRCLR